MQDAARLLDGCGNTPQAREIRGSVQIQAVELGSHSQATLVFGLSTLNMVSQMPPAPLRKPLGDAGVSAGKPSKFASALRYRDRMHITPKRSKNVPAAGLKVACAWVLVSLCGTVQAASWSETRLIGAALATPSKTMLIEIRQGSDLSRRMRGLRSQSFESAGGERVAFSAWYGSNWTDMHATWMTQLSANTGVIWGLGTGEQGRKYTISPSVKIGFIHRAHISRRTALTLRATTTLGARLREKSCTADFGDIGGIQTVNCRLAASTLEPAETLRYLFNEKSGDRHQLSVSLNHVF